MDLSSVRMLNNSCLALRYASLYVCICKWLVLNVGNICTICNYASPQLYLKFSSTSVCTASHECLCLSCHELFTACHHEHCCLSQTFLQRCGSLLSPLDKTSPLPKSIWTHPLRSVMIMFVTNAIVIVMIFMLMMVKNKCKSLESIQQTKTQKLHAVN
jgi:hypothetical protein